MEKLERDLLEEIVRRRKMEYYQKNPMAWLKERFGENPASFKWSILGEQYEDHKYDGDKDPIFNAWQSLADGEWASLSAATGTGKTYTLSRIVYWFLDCFPDSLIVTSAPKEQQLKLHLWSEIGKSFMKFKKIRPEAKLTSLRLSLSDIDEENPYDGHQAVGFVAGTGSDEQSATKAQGFHREHMLIITEETPGMGGAVMTAFKNTSTGDNNLILAVGNPDSELDELAQFSELAHVNDFRISAYDYPNVVLKRTIFPGAVTVQSIERRKNDYGEDSPLFLSRVRGISPKQSSNSVIHIDWIEKAFKRKVVKDEIFYKNALGVDVANSQNGDLASCCYGEGSTLMDVIEFRCPSASDITYNLIYDDDQLDEIEQGMKDNRLRTMRKYLSVDDTNTEDEVLFQRYPIPLIEDYDIQPQDIGVDAVGVGVSTINTFKNLGFKVTSLHGGQWEEAIPVDRETGKPMYKFMNLRAQMWWELREDLRKGKLRINIKSKDIQKRIKKELGAPRFEMRENAIVIESKDKIIKKLAKSPNLGDSIVYWNWMRKGYRSRNSMALPMAGG